MKRILLICSLWSASLSAAPGADEFRALIAGADKVVIKWGEDFPVEDFGLTRVKARYESRVETEAFASSIVFVEKPAPIEAPKLDFTEEDMEAGKVVMPMTWCSHIEHYTHRIEFSKAGAIVAEVRLAVDGRPQAIVFADGRRVWISDDSVARLKKITDSDREFEIVREIFKKREKEGAIQPPQTTTGSGAPDRI